MTYTGGSLFSGIGGMDLGFALAGFDILFQAELNPYCRKVLKKHAGNYWPNAKRFADVRAIGCRNLPRVDVLFGGFPCQDISWAGSRAGIIKGTQSSLWSEFARIIGEIRPRVILLENVEGITKSHKKEDGSLDPPDMGLVLAALSNLGYDARWGIISASDAGAPHQRNRWFCVAYARIQRLQESSSTQERSHHEKWPAEIEEQARSAIGSTIERNNQILGYAYVPRLQRVYRESESRIAARPIRRQGRETRVGNEPRMGGNAHGIPAKLDGNRLMAHRWPALPHEMPYAYEPERLTGTMRNRRDRVKALGNAVIPQIIYAIACEIMVYLRRLDNVA